MKPEELVKLKEHLGKSLSSQKDSSVYRKQVTLDLLEQLSSWTANPELLKSTRIGITVNDIRKNNTSSQEVKDFARDLVVKWKKDVEKVKSVKSGPQSTSPEKLPVVLEKTNSESNSISGTQPLLRTLSSDGIDLGSSRDKIRDKCTEMLYSALASGTDEESQFILKKSKKLESLVFEEFNIADGKYKARLRSLISNLKDKNNPRLKESLLQGTLSVEKLAKMTPEEMMSKEKQKQVEEAIKVSIHEAVTAADTQSETDMFRCGKCKQRKTKYYQMQTRSADEPMTTFVTCINCGNRWKFC